MLSLRFVAAAMAAMLSSNIAVGRANASPALVVERDVIVMRHGIRAPLDGEVPDGTRTGAPWAVWPVAESRLTPHGLAALERVAADDRRRLVAAGVLPTGCPAAGTVRIWTNVSERTIESGTAYARGFAPGCTLPVGHRPVDDVDPLFEPLRAGTTGFDASRAVRSIEDYTGGMARLVARHRGAIAALDRVLGCAPVGDGCVPGGPATVAASQDGRGIDLRGAIRTTSGVAQVLLLQYAQGLPVGAGTCCRVDAATLTRVGALHAALFDVFTRAPYMTAHQAGPLGQRVLATLADAHGPRVEVLMGHDTNVTALGAALGVRLIAPGYAEGDVGPGSALIVEQLRDGGGRRFVRVWYRTQSPGQLRDGSNAVTRRALTVRGCATLCPAARFASLLRARIVPEAGR